MELDTSTILYLIGAVFIVAEMAVALSVIFLLLMGIAFVAAGVFVQITGLETIAIISTIICCVIISVFFTLNMKTKCNNKTKKGTGNIYIGETFTLTRRLPHNTPTRLQVFGVEWTCTLKCEINAQPGDMVIVTEANVGRLVIELVE